MHSSLQLIVFDLGNVVFNLAGSWERACAFAGVPYRPFTLTPEEHARLQELEVLVESGTISMNEHRERLGELLQGLYNPAELAAMYQAIIQEEFAGIYETVIGLKTAGYRTACLSNTCAAHWTDMTNPALYPAIGALDFQHASHLLGVVKPDPRIYRRFETATGYGPAQILFFDDRQENVVGAQACGWKAVRIDPAQPPVAQIHRGLAAHGIHLTAPASGSQTLL